MDTWIHGNIDTRKHRYTETWIHGGKGYERYERYEKG
jgi:hypothetical protein